MPVGEGEFFEKYLFRQGQSGDIQGKESGQHTALLKVNLSPL